MYFLSFEYYSDMQSIYISKQWRYITQATNFCLDAQYLIYDWLEVEQATSSMTISRHIIILDTVDYSYLLITSMTASSYEDGRFKHHKTIYPTGAHKFTPGFQWSSCCSIFSFLCSVLQIVVCPFPFSHCLAYPSSTY